MNYPNTTQVPNRFFDQLLPHLTLAETKILLVIIRQTYGWIDNTTKARKQRDRISYGQFIQKTGLSRRVITNTIKSLIAKQAVVVTDWKGNMLTEAQDRIGNNRLFYSANLNIRWPLKNNLTQRKKLHHISNFINATFG